MFNNPARSRSPQTTDPSPAHEAAVDRLIEMASDAPRTAAKPGEALAVHTPAGIPDAPKELQTGSMWKTLGQLKSVLPYVSKLLPLLDARFLPLLELLGASHPHNASLGKEMHQNLGDLQNAQQEFRLAIQNQTLDIKQLEDQIVQLREACERQSQEQADLLQDVRSMGSLIRAVSAGIAILLVVLILMVGALLAHIPR